MCKKKKQNFKNKGKKQILSKLMQGELLGRLFQMTTNGDEVYYKGNWPICPSEYDQIIYIPDVFVSDIPVYRSARQDEYDWLNKNFYTANDFLQFAHNDPVYAQAMLQSMTGQNPNLQN